MEENRLTEEQIKHQQEVDKVKEALLESIRLKDPKLWYKLTHKEGYKPWVRQEYFSADINQEKRDITFKHKIYRNEPCSCGSGKKVKNCCETKVYYTIPKAV